MGLLGRVYWPEDDDTTEGGPCGSCPGWSGPLTAWRCGDCGAGECEACETWSPAVVDVPPTGGATVGHRLCVGCKAEHDADVAATGVTGAVAP